MSKSKLPKPLPSQLLMQFCTPPTVMPRRPPPDKPFVWKGWLYATNAEILVRQRAQRKDTPEIWHSTRSAEIMADAPAPCMFREVASVELFAHGHYADRYLSLIKRLPRLRVCEASAEPYIHGYKLWFRFQGGEGLLMSLEDAKP